MSNLLSSVLPTKLMNIQIPMIQPVDVYSLTSQQMRATGSVILLWQRKLTNPLIILIINNIL